MKNWILGLSLASAVGVGAMGCGEQSDDALNDDEINEGAEGDEIENAEARGIWLPWWRRRDGGFTFPGWPTRDAGTKPDAGTDGSIGRCDSGVTEPETDAGLPEEPEDAGLPEDSGTPPVPDAGRDSGTPPVPDAGRDSGTPVQDAGRDSGTPVPDAGRDSGTPVPDAGKPDSSTPPDPCAGLTYDSFGKGFLTTYCVNCHGNSQMPLGGLNATSLASIKTNADHIYEHAVGTPHANPMPPPGLPQPSPAEKKKLGDWLECGPN